MMILMMIIVGVNYQLLWPKVSPIHCTWSNVSSPVSDLNLGPDSLGFRFTIWWCQMMGLVWHPCTTSSRSKISISRSGSLVYLEKWTFCCRLEGLPGPTVQNPDVCKTSTPLTVGLPVYRPFTFPNRFGWKTPILCTRLVVSVMSPTVSDYLNQLTEK